jgi:uncharacterized membrane protein YgcG
MARASGTVGWLCAATVAATAAGLALAGACSLGEGVTPTCVPAGVGGDGKDTNYANDCHQPGVCDDGCGRVLPNELCCKGQIADGVKGPPGGSAAERAYNSAALQPLGSAELYTSKCGAVPPFPAEIEAACRAACCTSCECLNASDAMARDACKNACGNCTCIETEASNAKQCKCLEKDPADMTKCLKFSPALPVPKLQWGGNAEQCAKSGASTTATAGGGTGGGAGAGGAGGGGSGGASPGGGGAGG